MLCILLHVIITFAFIFDRSSRASPDNNDERSQVILYDSVDDKKQSTGQLMTADNPQYGTTVKRSDSITSDPNLNENDNIYYAIS